ncbi:response regulator, partial [Pseudomonas syringae]
VAEANGGLAREPFDGGLTGMRLRAGEGRGLVQHIQHGYPHVPVAVITAHGNLGTAINALKAGAFDFVTKPVALGRLRELVNSALSLPGAPPTRSLDTRLLGDSLALRTFRNQLGNLARSHAPLYTRARSVSGKALLARLIYDP